VGGAHPTEDTAEMAMSKKIKQMEMNALKIIFQNIRNLVVMTSNRVDAGAEYQFRKAMREKKIKLQVVKNTLARRVLGDLGITIDGIWAGPTMLAFGGESIKELSTALDDYLKKWVAKDPKQKDKVKFKAAVAEGQQVTFEQARVMPTRQEAIGEVVGMILGPGSQIAGCLIGPVSQVASQIQTISEKKPEEAPAEAPADTPTVAG
jgi:large subunit ribosomal protein L10